MARCISAGIDAELVGRLEQRRGRRWRRRIVGPVVDQTRWPVASPAPRRHGRRRRSSAASPSGPVESTTPEGTRSSSVEATLADAPRPPRGWRRSRSSPWASDGNITSYGPGRQGDAAVEHPVEERRVAAERDRCRGASKSVGAVGPKKRPTSGPTRGTTAATPASSNTCWSPSARRVADAVERVVGAVSSSPSTARPAAVASGFPDSVPAWYTGPSGARCDIDVARPAERADRQAAADDLAEAPQVGGDARPLGGATEAEPEAGDDLVEEQQRADAVALGAQAGQEPVGRRDQAHVGGDRLDDDHGRVVVERRARRCRAPRRCRPPHRRVTPAESGEASVPSTPSATPEPAAASRASEWPW